MVRRERRPFRHMVSMLVVTPMMRPKPCSIMWGTAAWDIRKGPPQVYIDNAEPGIWLEGPEVVLAAGSPRSEPSGSGVDAGVIDQDVQPAQLADGAVDSVVH